MLRAQLFPTTMLILRALLFFILSANRSYSYIDINFVMKFSQVTDFLYAFRRNATMQQAIEKTDKMADLVTMALNINMALSSGLRRVLCRMYGIQMMLRTRKPVIYDIAKTLLTNAGLLRIPFNSSDIDFLNFDNDFDASISLIYQTEDALDRRFMRNLVLKYDDPLKTGE